MTGPDGRLIWISDGLPGATHDITAARHHNVFGLISRAGLYLSVDKGYVGGETDLLLAPYKGRDLPDRYQDANRDQTKIRANGRRSFATFKNWHIFDRFRGCPRNVGSFAQAMFVLENEGREKPRWKKLCVPNTAGTNKPSRPLHPAQFITPDSTSADQLQAQVERPSSRIGRAWPEPGHTATVRGDDCAAWCIASTNPDPGSKSHAWISVR
ncbi:transposase family protein [Candidatus Protofrankia californiensis]|uniref:transposase family protein n=1 Tax=Candidatus Protofrankia californiensis TaxID=1839754 RepID=UPI0010417EC9